MEMIKLDNMVENVLGFFTEKPKRDVALVLSTGGARGLAHIGAIYELLEEGFHITSIAGTSMGALIGGMYAAGRLDDYKEWMKTIDKRKIRSLIDIKLGRNSFVKGDRIINAMKEIVPDVRIEDMQIPYRAVATDVITGKEVIFTKGSLYEAIRASISMPGFYEPVRYGNKVLVDGGLSNPLPLNRVKRSKKDLLVAVDVSGHNYQAQLQFQHEVRKLEREKIPLMSLIGKLGLSSDEDEMNLISLLNRSFSISIHHNALTMLKLLPPDIYVGIPMTRYTTFDFDKAERLEAIGRNYMRKAIERYQDQ